MKNYSKPQKRSYEKAKKDVRKPRRLVGRKRRKSDSSSGTDSSSRPVYLHHEYNWWV